MLTETRQVDLKYINRYHHSWPAAINLLANKVIDLKPLITHRFKLEQAVEALTAAADRSSGSVKVHIVDDADDEDIFTVRAHAVISGGDADSNGATQML